MEQLARFATWSDLDVPDVLTPADVPTRIVCGLGASPSRLEPPPHAYFTKEVDAQSATVTVYSWSDDRANSPGQAAPGAIPTPFNPNPFPPTSNTIDFQLSGNRISDNRFSGNGTAPPDSAKPATVCGDR